jgi:hypothetical protein
MRIESPMQEQQPESPQAKLMSLCARNVHACAIRVRRADILSPVQAHLLRQLQAFETSSSLLKVMPRSALNTKRSMHPREMTWVEWSA